TPLSDLVNRYRQTVQSSRDDQGQQWSSDVFEYEKWPHFRRGLPSFVQKHCLELLRQIDDVSRTHTWLRKSLGRGYPVEVYAKLRGAVLAELPRFSPDNLALWYKVFGLEISEDGVARLADASVQPAQLASVARFVGAADRGRPSPYACRFLVHVVQVLLLHLQEKRNGAALPSEERTRVFGLLNTVWSGVNNGLYELKTQLSLSDSVTMCDYVPRVRRFRVNPRQLLPLVLDLSSPTERFGFLEFLFETARHSLMLSSQHGSSRDALAFLSVLYWLESCPSLRYYTPSVAQDEALWLCTCGDVLQQRNRALLVTLLSFRCWKNHSAGHTFASQAFEAYREELFAAASGFLALDECLAADVCGIVRDYVLCGGGSNEGTVCTENTNRGDLELPGSLDSGDSKSLKLRSSDGELFEVNVDVALQSKLVQATLESCRYFCASMGVLCATAVPSSTGTASTTISRWRFRLRCFGRSLSTWSTITTDRPSPSRSRCARTSLTLSKRGTPSSSTPCRKIEGCWSSHAPPTT
ncbi:MAG: hypothetical protein MHM6MM_007585, partial [Cercozoa sp. M6MM]